MINKQFDQKHKRNDAINVTQMIHDENNLKKNIIKLFLFRLIFPSLQVKITKLTKTM